MEIVANGSVDPDLIPEEIGKMIGQAVLSSMRDLAKNPSFREMLRRETEKRKGGKK